jgi:hypothetical protein
MNFQEREAKEAGSYHKPGTVAVGEKCNIKIQGDENLHLPLLIYNKTRECSHVSALIW